RQSNKTTAAAARLGRRSAPPGETRLETNLLKKRLLDAPLGQSAISPSIQELKAQAIEGVEHRGDEGHKETADSDDSGAADDALGLYLRQMGSIPLLSRQEELTLAQRLERARNRFRRAALSSWLVLDRVYETLERVRAGKLPLDPSIDVVTS